MIEIFEGKVFVCFVVYDNVVIFVIRIVVDVYGIVIDK